MIKVNSFNYNNGYTGLKPADDNQTSFKGKLSYADQIMESLPQKKVIKYMKGLEWLKGEIGGILITALGTGLVAPIFIGFNPFVKAPKNATPEQKEENKNTKLYTAMRQPISAVLAILFQASVQKYIDKGLDFVFNNKNISKFARTNLDQQELNTKTFIQSKVKKAMKQEGIEKPSWIKTLFSKDAKKKRTAYDEEFNARVADMQNRQVDAIAKKFAETGKINVGERHLDFESTAKLINKQIDDYIEDARALQKSPEAIAKYLDRAEMLVHNEDQLKDIFRKVSKDNVTSAVQEALTKEQNPEVKVLLQEILDRPEDLRYSRVQRTLQRIKTIKEMCNGEFSRDAYRTAMLERNKVLTERIVELTGTKIQNLKGANEQTIKSAIDKVVKQCNFEDVDGITKSVLMDTDTFHHRLGDLTKKVYKDIIKGYKKLVENNYKSWNQFTKIGVGVFITLPITCTALNWVYPRFMDIFFPSLAGVRDKKHQPQEKIGGNK